MNRLLGVGAMLFLSSSASAIDFRDPKRGFSLTIPEGYAESVPEGGAVLRSFTRGSPGSESFRALRLEALSGTIGRGGLNRPIVEKAARASIEGTGLEATSFDYRTVKWKGFDLDLVVTHVANAELKLVTFAVQVPLATGAIQLGLLGSASDEQELFDELGALLGSLEGRSNWLSERELDARQGERVGFVLGLGVSLASIALVVTLAVRRKRRASR